MALGAQGEKIWLGAFVLICWVYVTMQFSTLASSLRLVVIVSIKHDSTLFVVRILSTSSSLSVVTFLSKIMCPFVLCSIS